MKKEIIILIGFLMCMFSCTKSRNSIVKEEFYNYVNQSFDNPKDLSEIVSVEPIDTISYEALKSEVELLYGIAEQTDSLVEMERSQFQSITSRLRGNKPITGNNNRNILGEWLARQSELSNDMMEWVKLCFDETRYLKIEIDSLLESNKNLLLYEYEIKTRIKKGTDLKLKSYYALEDSVKIRFFDKKPTFDDYSKSTAQFYEAANKYEELYNIRYNIVLEKLKLNETIEHIIE